MRYLRQTLLAIGLLVLLELLKKIFDRIAYPAIGFHHNFFSCAQLAIFLWLMISLLAMLLRPGVSNRKFSLAVLAALIAVLETLFGYWLYHPSKIPAPLVPAFREYYMGIQRNHIQWNPLSSAFNKDLFYTLKPSSRFVFRNYEFANEYRTNKLGLRDDDSALVKPAIICLGDSYAMGWGVEQDETFAKLLQQYSGEKTLNAGVSSYGTAREILNLDRLDTSAVKYIIIQYCRNDTDENAAFAREKYSLYVSPEAEYNLGLRVSYWSKFWFPGKHFLTIARMFTADKLKRILPGSSRRQDGAEKLTWKKAAADFVDILDHSAIDFGRTKVYCMDVSEREALNNDFSDAVRALIASGRYAQRFQQHLAMIPVADLLTPDDYYILDDHLRPSGHRKIAERLWQEIRSGR